MKTNMLIVAALALSVNAFAQNSCGIESAQPSATNTDDKMASMNQNVSNERVSVIDPSWVAFGQSRHHTIVVALVDKDGYKMEGNAMFAVKGGHQTGMFNYTTIKNGDLVLVNGVVITTTGEMLFLKNGDSVDMEGTVTRNPANDNIVAAK